MHPRSSFILHPSSFRSRAFTLVELLVSIGILALLIGLVVKGVSKFRKAAQATDSANTIMTIQNAINQFHADNHKYPGALPNAYLGMAPPYPQPLVSSIATSVNIKVITPLPNGYAGAAGNLAKITGTENLVLDLYGGLFLDTTAAPAVLTYDPARIGTGAGSLNPANPKKSIAYLSEQKLLSDNWNSDTHDGHYKDDAGEADDSIVPELVDRFPQPMPILYLRASAGFQLPPSPPAAAPTALSNNVITAGYAAANPGQTAGQYQLEQIIGYTGSYTGSYPALTPDTAATPAGKSIGEGKSLNKGSQYMNAGSPVPAPPYYHGLRAVAANLDATIAKGDPKFTYPYDAYAYLKNPALSTPTTAVARQKDSFILISAGPDRIYGTEDDITSFGSVAP